MGLLDRILNRSERDAPKQAAEATPAPVEPRNESDDWRLRPWTFQDMTFPPLGEWSYAPVRPTVAVGINFREDEDEWEVVGESRFLTKFSPIVEAWRNAGAVEDELRAILVQEPLNPFDRHAVRVDLNYEESVATCGYIPRERAFRMFEAVREHYELGRIVVTGAKAYGGESPDRPNIGVWLGGQVAKS